MKIRIQQFGKERIIHIDGKSHTTDELLALCNIDEQTFLRNINSFDREQIVCEWILKARAGISARCKLYWYRDTPMWAQKVIDETNVCLQEAMKRLRQWVKDGDMEMLLRPKYLRDILPFEPVTPTIKREKPAIKKYKRRVIKPSKPVKPTVKPSKPEDYGNWGNLSNKPRTHNLNKI